MAANETRLCATTALNTASPNNVQTHCKLCAVQQLAARVGLKKFPPDAHGEANLNLATSQSVAAPAELSAPAESRQGVTATKTSDSADYAGDPVAHADERARPSAQFDALTTGVGRVVRPFEGRAVGMRDSSAYALGT